jgi:hypothetical protein
MTNTKQRSLPITLRIRDARARLRENVMNTKRVACRSPIQILGRVSRTIGIAILVTVTLSACDQHPKNSGNISPNPNVPTAAEQQAIFSSAQFTAPVFLRIPADDFRSSQILASENGSTVEWWTFVRSKIGCVQQGAGASSPIPLKPSVDGYNIDGTQLESVLERAGVRAVQSYSLTLDPTPWGTAPYSFSCTVNTGNMAPFAQGQDMHGALAISIVQRVCSRWTFVNHYQTAVPGQGNAQVFAGTFAYSMKPLVDGAQFTGDGTASVKMYLNPDNGQWTIASFELHDPPLSISNLSGVEQAAPTQTDCGGP